MITMDKKHEDALMDEQFEIEFEIILKLTTLIDAKWDSNTVKIEIEKLVEDFHRIGRELYLEPEER